MKFLFGLTVFVLHATWSVTCSALTVSNNGHLLKIIGDKGHDLIETVDNGAGSLSVNGTPYHGVSRLVIDAKGGNDTSTYDTLDGLSLSSIQIDLGPCDDNAELNLGTVGAHVQSEVHGGAGIDEITRADLLGASIGFSPSGS